MDSLSLSLSRSSPCFLSLVVIVLSCTRAWPCSGIRATLFRSNFISHKFGGCEMKIGTKIRTNFLFFFFFRKEILINIIWIWRWGGRESEFSWEDISIRICGCSTIILKRAYNLRIMELDYPCPFFLLSPFTFLSISVIRSLCLSSCLSVYWKSEFDYGRLCGLRWRRERGRDFRRDREIKRSMKVEGNVDLRQCWNEEYSFFSSFLVFYFYGPWRCPCDFIVVLSDDGINAR